jgi:O-methyltransferase
LKSSLRKTLAFFKGIILWLRPGVIFSFLASPFLFLSNLITLTKWVAQQKKKKHIYNDFFTLTRDPARKLKMYEKLASEMSLATEPIEYIEFGVHRGFSFGWWLRANKNPESRFYGFDTFEGLPEDWGTYGKGEMAAAMPKFDDSRYTMVKGLFQDTLLNFMESKQKTGSRKVIHLDADLFSSTLFVLTTLAGELKSGDILIFDEFSVPNHEWMAYSVFVKSFYVKTELVAAANNYFHVAFKVL